MSENEDDSHASERNALPPLSYGDYREYRRLLRMLDVRQHLNLSAHLYSSYLISRLTHGRMPHRSWAAWPLEDAPVPPQIMDDYPAAVPGVVRPGHIDAVRRQALQRFPMPPDPETDAPQVLLRACEEVLRRIVHRRIQNERSMPIEAVLEPEPELGGALSQAVMNTVDKYIARVPRVSHAKRLVSWQQLGIEGPARKRLQRLFDRDLSEYEDHIGEAASDSGAESGSDRGGPGSESPGANGRDSMPPAADGRRAEPASPSSSASASESAFESAARRGSASSAHSGSDSSSDSGSESGSDSGFGLSDASSEPQSDASVTGFTGSEDEAQSAGNSASDGETSSASDAS